MNIKRGTPVELDKSHRSSKYLSI